MDEVRREPQRVTAKATGASSVIRNHMGIDSLTTGKVKRTVTARDDNANDGWYDEDEGDVIVKQEYYSGDEDEDRYPSKDAGEDEGEEEDDDDLDGSANRAQLVEVFEREVHTY